MRVSAPVPDIVRHIADRVRQAGGRPLLVGGAVLDALRGVPAKDWDIEVFGLGYDRLAELFADLDPKSVGKSFGVLKFPAASVGGLDIDLSVPRRDNSVGKGHADFESALDPTMSAREAARRRDFSMNSMSIDLDTMQLEDPFGGHADLEAGVLRATDPETFVEDPLRALRAMQLLARKAERVDPATMALIRGMVDSFPHLAKERVHEEFRKLLLVADKPSIGLEFLRESGWLVHFPELHDLIGCEQHPEWHPEGDVWTHTLYVTDAAAWARRHVDPDWTEAFVLGVMLHDIGKPATTVTPEMVARGEYPSDRLFTAYGHDRAGEDPSGAFLRRMTNERELIERVRSIVGEHMQPWGLFHGRAKDASWKRLHNRIRLDIIGWMSRCDCCGREERRIDDPEFEHEVSEHCFDRFDDLGKEPIAPVVLGRHLIAAGFTPGPAFSPALAAAYDAQIEDPALALDDLVGIAVSRMGDAPEPEAPVTDG